MQYSQEHLKTMVYAKFGGANRVYYGELENRELFSISFRLYRACFTHLISSNLSCYLC